MSHYKVEENSGSLTLTSYQPYRELIMAAITAPLAIVAGAVAVIKAIPMDMSNLALGLFILAVLAVLVACTMIVQMVKNIKTINESDVIVFNRLSGEVTRNGTDLGQYSGNCSVFINSTSARGIVSHQVHLKLPGGQTAIIFRDDGSFEVAAPSPVKFANRIAEFTGATVTNS